MRRMQRLAEQLKLPKDSVLGAVIVTAIGNHEVCIENFRGILEYNDCCLKLQIRDGRLCICGKRLRIVCYNYEELKLTGCIESICYE